jgi:chromatin remodeling complex protein RSC6
MAKKLPPVKSMVKSIYDFPNMVSLNDTELPEIKEWKVGEKYKIELEVEQISMRKKDDGKMCAEFKILSAEAEKEESKEEEEDDENENEYKKGGKVKKEAKDSGGKTTSKATSTKSTPKSDKRIIGQYDMTV